MADGRIIIDTSIDSSGAEKDVKGLSGKLGSLASGALGAVAKITAGMATVAAGAVAALTTASIKQYAEWEQLVGGVETLFKDSADVVKRQAANAFRSAGLSANEYMETVTSFSASLLQGLGGDTKKAAQIGNQAVVDMSDNANKMGTSIDRIQDAYQGFAKANYTMLDNLKLGYGGTKAEMERLLIDAEKLTGIKYDINNFADIIEGIHVIQTEIGITGTTALEAEETISGSFNAMKSAWSNFVTRLGDDTANYDDLINDLVDTVGTFASNLLPTIKKVLSAIGENIPYLVEQFKELIVSFFPESMQESARKVFDGIGEAIKDVATISEKAFPIILDALGWIMDNANTIVTGVVAIGAGLAAFNVANMIMGLVKAFKAFKLANEGATVAQWLLNTAMMANPIGLIIAAIAGLIAGIVYLWNTNEGFRTAIINAWNAIKEAGIIVWDWLVKFFTVDIPNAWNSVVAFFSGIPAWFSELWNTIKQAFIDGWQAITDFFTITIPSWIEQIFNWFNELPYKIGYALGNLLGTIVKWGTDTWNYLTTNVPIWIDNVVTFFSELPGKIWTWLVNAYNNIVRWGKDTWNSMYSAASNAISAVIDWFASLPGKIWSWLLSTISKVYQFGRDLGSKASEAGSNMVSNIINAVANLPSRMADIGSNIVRGVWNGIVGMGSWIASKVSGFFTGIVDGAKAALGIHSPSRVFRDQVGKYMAQGVGVGFEDETENVKKSMDDDFKNLVAKMQTTVDYETAMTTARVVTHNNSLGGGVEESNSDSKERPIIVEANIIVDGKEFTQTVVAPNQDVLTDYYEGR